MHILVIQCPPPVFESYGCVSLLFLCVMLFHAICCSICTNVDYKTRRASLMKIKHKQYIPQIVAGLLSFASLCIIALIIDEQGGKYGVGIKRVS